jgi:hypothetical protein
VARKINYLAQTVAFQEVVVSALCPHSQRRGAVPRTYGYIQVGSLYVPKEAFMSAERDDQERPCLHCLIVELIDDFLEEHPATPDGSDTVGTDEGDEVIVAIAKTFAELTSRQDGVIRQQLIEQLMREIMNYDAEFRRDDATGVSGSHARH